MIYPERSEKLKQAAYRRQFNLTIVLENVHDVHNIGAVLRTCDSVGLKEIFILYTEPHLSEERIEQGSTTASGSAKWIDIHYYEDIDDCFEHIARDYDDIWSTHMAADSKSLYELDLTRSVALVFGNEHAGVSEAVLAKCTGNFLIPQQGFVQSLNISVACAISLYEACRQRMEKDFYTDNPTATEAEKEQLFQRFIEIHETRHKRGYLKRIAKEKYREQKKNNKR